MDEMALPSSALVVTSMSIVAHTPPLFPFPLLTVTVHAFHVPFPESAPVYKFFFGSSVETTWSLVVR